MFNISTSYSDRDRTNRAIKLNLVKSDSRTTFIAVTTISILTITTTFISSDKRQTQTRRSSNEYHHTSKVPPYQKYYLSIYNNTNQEDRSSSFVCCCFLLLLPLAAAALNFLAVLTAPTAVLSLPTPSRFPSDEVLRAGAEEEEGFEVLLDAFPDIGCLFVCL